MTRKIESKIVSYHLKSNDSSYEQPQIEPPACFLDSITEDMPRPEKLLGTTYKLKTPEHICEHALYITINDLILNQDTEHERRRPFEIFINCKSPEHLQWINTLTRLISAVFRKGGEITFLVEELHTAFDPKGGYWSEGKYIPSLTAEIGNILEAHFIEIGLLKPKTLDENQLAFLAKKQVETNSKIAWLEDENISPFPVSASMCRHCQNKAVIIKESSQICLHCGEVKSDYTQNH